MGKKEQEKTSADFTSTPNSISTSTPQDGFVLIENIANEELKIENTDLKKENDDLKNKYRISQNEISNLKNEKQLLKNETEKLKKEIEKLTNEITIFNKKDFKKENDNLKNENDILKNENQILKNEVENFKTTFDKFNLIKSEETNKLEEIYKKLNDENMKIIDYLVAKMNNNSVGQNINKDALSGEKMVAINFTSADQSINHTIICKNNTKFIDVEGELYASYPEYAENNNYFMFNGLKINRWKTLEENNIHGNTIVLNKIDKEKI